MRRTAYSDHQRLAAADVVYDNPLAAQPAPAAPGAVNRRIAASVLLQQVLYYTPIFSFGWVIFWVVWLFVHYFDALTYRDPDVARTVLIVVWAAAEPVRIIAGYWGNLQEHLPWLFLYAFLTVVPSHGTCYYLLVAAKDIDAATRAVQTGQAVLLEVSLLAGIHALWKVQRQQAGGVRLFEYSLRQRREAVRARLAAR